MATSLECRLLCTSVCAYSIQNDGTVAHDKPYFDAIQFAQEPKAMVAGGVNINACLVGTNTNGVVVSFRGTLPPASPNHEQTVGDWINDLHAELIHGGGLPGLVHEGFWDSLDSLWPWLLTEVQKQLADGGGGHNRKTR